jgi:hypothetical protein
MVGAGQTARPLTPRSPEAPNSLQIARGRPGGAEVEESAPSNPRGGPRCGGDAPSTDPTSDSTFYFSRACAEDGQADALRQET